MERINPDFLADKFQLKSQSLIEKAIIIFGFVTIK